MKPVLFSPASTAFTTNGIGRLSDAITCVVHEVRNGEFELEMTYPVDGAHYADIVHSAIIVAKPSARRKNQAFRIYKITRPMAGRVTVRAQHISYQMSFIPVAPFSATSLAGALAGLKSNAVESCPFTLQADFTSAVSYALSVPKSIRSCLGGSHGSILDVYGGGEWEFDNYIATLHRSRGEDNGYVIRYGKNLIDLTQEQNIQNTYTGIYPYYQTDDAMTVLTTEPKVIRSANAGNFPFQRTIEKDFSDKFDTTPTEAALRAAAEAYVAANNIGVPSVSLSIEFVNLADTEEYRDLLTTANLDLCDTVTVRFARLGVDVKSKVVEIEWNVLKERYDKIEVGTSRASLASTIADEMDRLAITPTAAQMHRSIDMATGTLNKAMGGYVIYNRNRDGHPNETLYLDENSGGNLYASTHILRINYAGIGFSDNGYGGPYSQSWDLLGHLTLGGINNSYGDFTILDENAVPVIQIDKNGFVLWNISAKGYLNNGVLYEDADLTTPITPTEGYYYYDVVGRAVYLWDGSAYTAQTDNGGIYAKMTHDGLGVYHGVIDFSWGENSVGFYADGTKVQIGDFICDSSSYGRGIFQSTDEVTGMSADPNDPEKLFLWAGYYGPNDYVLVVNGSDAYVMHNGKKYAIGAEIEKMKNLEYEDETDPDPTEQQEIWDGSSPDGKPDPGYINAGPDVQGGGS